MSTKHAKEPWRLNDFEGKIYIANENMIVASIDSDSKYAYFNAKRIIECVNAMQGIEDPSAFMEVVKKLELDQYRKLEKAVRDMRAAQKAYFSKRLPEKLHLSKLMEHAVDQLLSNQKTFEL